MMKKIILCLAIVVFLNGCAGSIIRGTRFYTTGDIMASWVGSSEEKLISSWGVPWGSYALKDGGKLLTWKSIYCTQTFLINSKGIVDKWKFSDGCSSAQEGDTLPRSTPIPKATL